jgi:hypothetical protein
MTVLKMFISGHYSEPVQQCFCNIHFNIILPFKSWSSKLSLPFRFSDEMVQAFLTCTMRSVCAANLKLSDLVALTVRCEG